jgi:hypothetical protein
VYLYSPALPGIIIGRLLDLNLTKRKIVLSGLSLCDHGWSERLFDRIKPDPPIYVNVSSNFRSLGHMCVSNLSAAGMRVICIKNKDRCVESDMPVRLTFQLPRDDSLINLPGKVAHVRQAGNLTRLGFHLNPTMSQQRRLSQYVLEQKAKIMKELKTVFISMQQPRHTQDLYF